jgi:hypothetical protein
MLSLFNEIMTQLHQDCKNYQKSSTESSLECCERRQMYLAGLSRQFWMHRSNLTVLRTFDVLHLHSILSSSIGSFTEEKGHQVYGRIHLVSHFTIRSLLQPM